MTQAHLQTYNDFVERHLKRNFFLNVCDGVCFFLGVTVISVETILPVLVTRLGGGNLVVSLIPFFTAISFGLGPLMVARRVEQLDIKRNAILVWGGLMRFPLLLIGVLILTLGTSHPTLVLAGLLAGLLMHFLFGAASASPYFDMVAKVIPLRVRGRMLSLRTMCGYGAGILGGMAATKILGAVGFPRNFGLLFVLGFLFSATSLIFLGSIKEPVYPHKPARKGKREYFRNLFHILREDKQFARFLLTRAFLVLAGSGNAFFAVYGIRHFALSDTYAGVFTLVGVVACIAVSPILGLIGDKIGHKVNLIIALSCPAVAAAVALIADDVVVYCGVFALTSAMQVAIAISSMTMTVEYCKPEDRPTYIGLAGAVITPFSISAILMGTVVQTLGYTWLFWILIGIGAVGVTHTATQLRDPTRARRAKPALR